MEYTELYYSETVGASPGQDSEAYRQTTAVFEYLQDAGVQDADILRFLEETPPKEDLSFDDLPEWLWEDSLLKPNTFYYHRRLHVVSPAPKYNPATGQVSQKPFSMEMIISFTLEDLADYFYEKTRFPPEMIDIKRDLGALTHLLNRYGRMGFIQDVDFVLALIDQAAEQMKEGHKVLDIFSIENEKNIVYEKLVAQHNQAKVSKRNRIVWRGSG